MHLLSDHIYHQLSKPPSSCYIVLDTFNPTSVVSRQYDSIVKRLQETCKHRQARVETNPRRDILGNLQSWALPIVKPFKAVSRINPANCNMAPFSRILLGGGLSTRKGSKMPQGNSREVVIIPVGSCWRFRFEEAQEGNSSKLHKLCKQQVKSISKESECMVAY